MAKLSKILQSKRQAKFAVRQHNRCSICGRPKGYFRKFGVCRICLRGLAHQGALPGVVKSSW